MKFFFLLPCAAAAIAQTNSTGGVTGAFISSTLVSTASPNGIVTSTIGPGMPGGAVTGVPYSAEQVTEHVQTLADGTHISQSPQKTKFYRDSQGRTRTEHTFALPPGAAAGVEPPGFIEIFDPVAGARYTLEPRNHTARKMSFPAALPPPPPPPNSATASGNRLGRFSSAAVPAPAAPASNDQTPRPQFSHESLGTQTIEGIAAEGNRTTVVYPVGAVGNDRPITTVSETWMSPELRTVILSKNSDPRNGESTTRLTNISRLEPDPSLFQIPPDYEVVDSQGAATKQ